MSSVVGDIISVGTLGLVDGGDITGENQAKAAQQAASTQAEAGQSAIDFQREALGLIRGDLQPFREFGQQQLGQLGQVAGQGFQPTLTPEQVQAPQSLQDIPFFNQLADVVGRETTASQASRGKLFSGGTQEELFKRLAPAASALATDEMNRRLASRGQFAQEQQGLFGQQLAGQGQRFNQLFGLAGIGQSAAAQQAAQQQAGANQIGNLLTGIGNVQAAGQVGAAQARGGALGGLLGLGGQLGSAYLMSDMRAKENIEPLGNINGIPWFKFDYIDGEKGVEGTIAQFIEDDHPDAVAEIEGVKHVNYGALPIWN